MNRRRAFALALCLVTLAGCAATSSSGSRSSNTPPRDSAPPRVRCLSDPARDNASSSRPMIFLFCAESP